MPSVAECLNIAPVQGAESIARILDGRTGDPIARAAAEALRHLAAMVREHERTAPTPRATGPLAPGGPITDRDGPRGG